MRWPPLLAKTEDAVMGGIMMTCYAGLSSGSLGDSVVGISISLEGVALN